jgi:hypothetical protein
MKEQIVVVDLESYRLLLKHRLYHTWRTTLDDDVFQEDQIVTDHKDPVAIEEHKFPEFLGRENDTFYFTI